MRECSTVCFIFKNKSRRSNEAVYDSFLPQFKNYKEMWNFMDENLGEHECLASLPRDDVVKKVKAPAKFS
jgi:hypothetical protein